MNHVVRNERRSGFRKLARLKMGILYSFTVLAAPAAGTCDPPPVDITGTWVAKLITVGFITTPLFPLAPAGVNIEAVVRMNISQSGGNFVHKLEICKLATTSAPEDALKITYSPALLATMSATVAIPTYNPTIGGPITVPSFVLQTGSNKVCSGDCGPSDFVDSDRDGKPGVTLPVLVGGALELEAYGALTTIINLSRATLEDAETIAGAAAFSTEGQILHTNNPIAPGGPLTVDPTPLTAVTAKRLAGDVPCSTVAGMFP